jgi:hypothetical protein
MKRLLNSTVALGLTAFLTVTVAHAQRQKLYANVEYQFINYSFLTAGLGYGADAMEGKYGHLKYSFVGLTVNYSRSLIYNDWGSSLQLGIYPGATHPSLGFALEGNYKSINKTNHFCFKPLIGFSFPIASLMYAYNFDFYKIKTERINQHEIILDLRLVVLRIKQKKS